VTRSAWRRALIQPRGASASRSRCAAGGSRAHPPASRPLGGVGDGRRAPRSAWL